MVEPEEAIDRGEELITQWKNSEPRIWGRLISRTFRLLDWKAFYTHLMHALHGADEAAVEFLRRGMERWEREGRMGAEEAASLRTRIASDETQEALHHMGAHLVLSMAVSIPVPGLRSLAHFGRSFAFWAKVQVQRLRRAASQEKTDAPTIHNLLVRLPALVPLSGAVAYLAARPLRNGLLVRPVMDEAAWMLPFSLYGRMHLGRWLAPTPR